MNGIRGWRATAAIAALLWLTGCLDESRLNTRCEWTGDAAATRLDMNVARDRRHLANDVRIAGENSVRYADAAQPSVGVPVATRMWSECLGRLSATIATQHTVDTADIAAAFQMRDVPVDLALIYLPVGVVLFIVSLRMCRRRFRHLPPPGERWTALASAVGAGILTSGAAQFVAYFVSWNVDTARFRDFHMSFRASYLPIGRHPWVAFLSACAVFTAACLYEYRAARVRPAREAKTRFSGEWRR